MFHCFMFLKWNIKMLINLTFPPQVKITFARKDYFNGFSWRYQKKKIKFFSKFSDQWTLQKRTYFKDLKIYFRKVCCTVYNMPKCRFSLSLIFPYLDRTVDFVLIPDNPGQFWTILAYFTPGWFWYGNSDFINYYSNSDRISLYSQILMRRIS